MLELSLAILKIIAILLAISLLILIHEFCHFIVARRCGVKILRFSIGFGKSLYTWKDRLGTEYRIAPILFGGYVKMLDSHEQKLHNKDKKFAFDQQSLSKRTAIVLAGPIGNFLCCLITFWLVFVIGFITPKPIIANILQGSPAAIAGLLPGDEIYSIDKQHVNTWGDALFGMMAYFGENKKITISVRRGQEIITKPDSLDISSWQNSYFQNDLFKEIGIITYHPLSPAIVDVVAKNTPAARAKLQRGDLILTIGKDKIRNWDDCLESIKKHPKENVQITLQRGERILHIPVAMGWKYGPGWGKVGYLGVKIKPVSWPPDMVRKEKYGPLLAIFQSWQESAKLTAFNYLMFKKLFTGRISLRALSGPIMIYQSAASAFDQGGIAYLNFIAILSLILAFTNLLPIPTLDGGYLIFFAIEAVRKKPVSLQWQTLIYRLGLIALLVLMVQATVNDLSRLFS
ncbi:MAG: RIP metalloprotease RseP [Gammaproteobacteria bacterium]